ncbi:MAG: D-lactate dehydrogenase, partial [Edwardsiella sp. (in: enterobacteria)]
IGGICNNSGGALVQRGPAYTEMALYGRVNERGEAELVNHLGIALGETPEAILTNLAQRHYGDADVQHDARRASDHQYAQR